jgi:hypothetical protein
MEICGEGSYIELLTPLVSLKPRVDQLVQLPSARRETSFLGRMNHRTLD